MRTRQRQPVPLELIEIRRESWLYTCKKPHRAPPADSPNRPMLARLWWEAHQVNQRKPKRRTFTLWGVRFYLVYVGERLGVLHGRSVLVLAPTSETALDAIVNPGAVQRG
jgi:hypothetical protein